MVHDVILLQVPLPKLEELQKTIFSSEVLEFIAALHRNFDKKIELLYENRKRRAVEIKNDPFIDFKNSPERRDKSWKIAPLPIRLQ